MEDITSIMDIEHSVPDSLAWASATEEEQIPIVAAGNVYGIFEKETLVGKVGFIEVDKKTWQVDGLVIQPQYHGKKYGTTLFTKALAAIIDKIHPTYIQLFVYPENSSAISLYLHCGFIIKEWISDKYGPGKHRLKLVKTIS
jgi:ribosomal protein S18 acetylase RimI-like enzyme